MRIQDTLGFQIKQMSTLLAQDMDARLKRAGIRNMSSLQIWVLHYLIEHQGEAVSQTDLQEAFGFRKSTVSELIGRMKDQGLVRSATVKGGDRRVRRIMLTETSTEQITRIDMFIRDSEERFHRHLSDEEIAAFFSLSKKITSVLNQRDDASKMQSGAAAGDMTVSEDAAVSGGTDE